jgi:hypothetical protein
LIITSKQAAYKASAWSGSLIKALGSVLEQNQNPETDFEGKAVPTPAQLGIL